jgi:hypothetical protein
MNRSTYERRPSRFATLTLVLFLSAILSAPGATPPIGTLLEIEPSQTWVGIARVHLQIDDLRQTGEMLEGTYQIRVPLSPGQNDTGRVQLRTPESIEQFGDNKATVTGSALSSTGEVHEVVVRVQPNGVVRIQVVTPKRTLQFKSRLASRRG